MTKKRYTTVHGQWSGTTEEELVLWTASRSWERMTINRNNKKHTHCNTHKTNTAAPTSAFGVDPDNWRCYRLASRHVSCSHVAAAITQTRHKNGPHKKRRSRAVPTEKKLAAALFFSPTTPTGTYTASVRIFALCAWWLLHTKNRSDLCSEPHNLRSADSGNTAAA